MVFPRITSAASNRAPGRAIREAFLQLKPSTFSGQDHPWASHNWLHEMESILCTCRFDGRHWTALAVGQLRDAALMWWEEEGKPTSCVSWEDFRQAFLASFPSAPDSSRRPDMPNWSYTACRTFHDMVAQWGPIPGESQLAYVSRFEDSLMRACPYPLQLHEKNELFLRGVPAQYTRLLSDLDVTSTYEHLRSTVLYLEAWSMAESAETSHFYAQQEAPILGEPVIKQEQCGLDQTQEYSFQEAEPLELGQAHVIYWPPPTLESFLEEEDPKEEPVEPAQDQKP